MRNITVSAGAVSSLDRVAIIEAAQKVLDTPVGAWHGKPTKLHELTDQLGTTQNVRQGAQAVARALLNAKMTFHDAITLPKRLMPARVDHAISHFCFLLQDDRELADTSRGRAFMLLTQMDDILAERIGQIRAQSPGRLAG